MWWQHVQTTRSSHYYRADLELTKGGPEVQVNEVLYSKARLHQSYPACTERLLVGFYCIHTYSKEKRKYSISRREQDHVWQNYDLSKW